MAEDHRQRIQVSRGNWDMKAICSTADSLTLSLLEHDGQVEANHEEHLGRKCGKKTELVELKHRSRGLDQTGTRKIGPGPMPLPGNGPKYCVLRDTRAEAQVGGFSGSRFSHEN